MWYWLRSPQTADVVIVVVITAATLSHGYASDICKPLDCMHIIQYFEAATMAGMVVASGVLLWRAFKYRNVEYSTVRNNSTLVVVVSASLHTVVHNTCQVLVGIWGICVIPYGYPTLLFLAMVCLVFIKPSKMWPIGADEAKAPDKEYHKNMVPDLFFVFMYWLVMVGVIVIVWEFELVVWFFKLEVFVPMLVGLFGMFTALWFANHERNKRIEENQAYKMQVLSLLEIVLWVVVDVNQQRATGTKKPSSGSDVSKTDLIRDGVLTYQDQRGHVYGLNANTYVPAQVRRTVSFLMQSVDIMLLPHTRIFETEVDAVTYLQTGLATLSSLDYFTNDRDPAVRKAWRSVTQNIDKVKEEFANR